MRPLLFASRRVASPALDARSRSCCASRRVAAGSRGVGAPAWVPALAGTGASGARGAPGAVAAAAECSAGALFRDVQHGRWLESDIKARRGVAARARALQREARGGAVSLCCRDHNAPQGASRALVAAAGVRVPRELQRGVVQAKGAREREHGCASASRDAHSDTSPFPLSAPLPLAPGVPQSRRGGASRHGDGRRRGRPAARRDADGIHR